MPWKWQHKNNPMLKYVYTIPEPIIWASQTDRFSLRNGPFRVLKRAVLQRQMVCIGNSLIINIIQRRYEGLYDVNYFYITLPVLCRPCHSLNEASVRGNQSISHAMSDRN